MQFIGELIIKSFRYFLALAIVLLICNGFSALSKDDKDFLYLSGIVKQVTSKKKSRIEKVKALTRWLSRNVAKTTEIHKPGNREYPDWFDGSSVASVIRGGVGNCGYQANNLITLARYLGIRKYNRYWVGKDSGSQYVHTFSELYIDGKYGVFDPYSILYIEDKDGNVLSLKDLVANPGIIGNDAFRKIITEIRDKPSVLKRSYAPATPEPLGPKSYAFYAAFGETATKMYLHLKATPLAIITISWFVFFILDAVLNSISNHASKKKHIRYALQV